MTSRTPGPAPGRRARAPLAWGPALAGALALAALGGCGAEQAPEPGAPPVLVAPVSAHDLEERIQASGALVARQQARVAAEVGGRVTAIVRDEGSEVAAGETMLRIDPERRRLELADAQAQLAQARAAAEEAGREYARLRALHAQGVASQARLEQVQTELGLARSRRDAAEARLGVARRALADAEVKAPFDGVLADAEVKAPFDGVLAERLVSEGEFVQPGTPLFDLVAMDPIDVEFHLPEADASRVRSGLDVEVSVAPWPGEPFPATVRFVAPTVDPATHTLLVRAALDNADRRLRPGLFAAVDLGVARREGVPMIPEEAVLQRADGEVVYRLGPDRTVERLRIDTGVHRDGRVEVTGGLEVGDRIVVRGHYALSDGMRVAPRPEGVPALAEGEETGAEVATP